MRKIVLFGGSFDPFHNGHADLVRHINKQIECDEIWILLTKQNPQKNDVMTSYDIRKEMILKTLKCQNKIKIKCYEDEVMSTYTIDTVSHILKKYHKDKFVFAIGMDQAHNLSSWHRSKELLEMIEFVIFNRANVNCQPGIIYKKGYIEDISSSQIRNYPLIKISKQTRRIIIDANLYLAQKVSSILSKHRYHHVCNVVTLACELAKKHHLDVNKAYAAAMLHDITKEMSKYHQYRMIKNKAQLNIDKIPFAILHQYSGYYYVKNHLGIRDKTILNAIRQHTTLSTNCTQFDKLIYIADKLSADREFDKKQAFLDIAQNSIDECAYQLYLYYYQKRLSNNNVIDLQTKKTLERLEQQR